MAKRRRRTDDEETALTRKQLARARRERKLRRRALIAVVALSSVVAVILVTGIVNELIVKPDQPVATVGSTEITTADFQERVRLQRAMIIDQYLELADLIGIEQAYQFSGAGLLDQYEVIGEQVLDAMVEEVLIRQAATEMGLQVSEDDVWQALEEQQGYFRHGTPTPRPTVTPWPSPTPITPTETLPTPLPTLTPLPSPTVVTEAAFEELHREQLRALKPSRVDEETYRAVVEAQLLMGQVRERLMEDEPRQVEHVELDLLRFGTAEDADAFLVRLDGGESFDALLDEARSNPEDGASATSIPWTPYDALSQRVGATVAQIALSREIGSYSQVINSSEEEFVIMRVTGHEERELSASALRSRQNELYSAWLEALKEAAEIERYDYWRNRVPRSPTLDPRELIASPSPAG